MTIIFLGTAKEPTCLLPLPMKAKSPREESAHESPLGKHRTPNIQHPAATDEDRWEKARLKLKAKAEGGEELCPFYGHLLLLGREIEAQVVLYPRQSV